MNENNSALELARMKILRYRAAQAVKYNLGAGKITKPDRCEKCGKVTERLEAHHESYDPKDVLAIRWLCCRCHSRRTQETRRLARSFLKDARFTPGFKGVPSWALKAVQR